MSKRTIWLFFSLISILLLLVMAGFVFIFLRFPGDSRSYAESNFNYLVNSAEMLLNEPERELTSREYRRFRDYFHTSPHLMAVQLFSPTQGTLYLAARDKQLYSGIFPGPRGTNKAKLSSDDDKLLLYRHPLSAGSSPLYLEALYRKTLPAERMNQLFILLILASISFILLMGLQFLNPLADTTSEDEAPLPGDKTTSSPSSKSLDSFPKKAQETQDLLRKLPATGKASSLSNTDTDDEPPCDPPQLYAPSGLVWERFLIDKLNQELNRAASFDHDLTLGLLEGPEELSRTQLARQLLKAFRYKDLLFEYGEKGAAVILPNLDLDTAASRFEEFEAELAREISQGFRFKAGVSSRSGRLLTGERLFKESESALKRSKTDKSNATILFRVDPKKFRQVISEKSF